jgi:hypothetical protein
LAWLVQFGAEHVFLYFFQSVDATVMVADDLFREFSSSLVLSFSSSSATFFLLAGADSVVGGDLLFVAAG